MRHRKAKATSKQAARQSATYGRVSTDDQATSGVTLDDQETRLRAYGAAMACDGLEVVLDAGESAKSLQRAGMTTLLDRVRRGEIARVVVTKLDRLTRSTRDLADLLDMSAAALDVSLVCRSRRARSAGSARQEGCVVNLLGVVAQWEREAIARGEPRAL